MQGLLQALPLIGKLYDGWRAGNQKEKQRFVLDALRGLKLTELMSAQAIYDLSAAQVSGRLFKNVDEVDDTLLSMPELVEYEPTAKCWRLRVERPNSPRYASRW